MAESSWTSERRAGETKAERVGPLNLGCRTVAGEAGHGRGGRRGEKEEGEGRRGDKCCTGSGKRKGARAQVDDALSPEAPFSLQLVTQPNAPLSTISTALPPCSLLSCQMAATPFPAFASESTCSLSTFNSYQRLPIYQSTINPLAELPPFIAIHRQASCLGPNLPARSFGLSPCRVRRQACGSRASNVDPAVGAHPGVP